MGKIAKADVIPVRQPNQYACVTTSLCMALRALGVPEDECSPARVNKVVGAMPLQGAAWEPMLAAANHYGMRATLTLPSTVRQLKEWTDAGKPVVIAWNPEGREWSHASLVFDVDDDLNVHIADPNIPDPDETVRVVPKGEFYSKWYEKAPQGFLIRRPACVIEREITPDGRQVMASRKKTAAHQKRADDFSDDSTVVEYAARQLMKRKRTTVAKAAKETAEALSGGTNLFIGGGHREVEIDPRKLESALWEYLVEFAQEQVRQFAPGMGHIAVAATINHFGLPKRDAKTLESKMSRRMASRGKTAGVVRDSIMEIDTYEVAETGRGQPLSLTPITYSFDDWEYIGEDGGVSVSWGQKSALMGRREFAAFAADMKKALAWAERYDYSKGRMASRVASRYNKQAESKRLDQGARRQINSLLIRAGLDGNGRFRSAQQGYARAVDVLHDVGIELDEVVSSHLFNQPSGTIRADIAFTNYTDRFSPISIDNSVLYLQYTELRDGVYEVVAYLS